MTHFYKYFATCLFSYISNLSLLLFSLLLVFEHIDEVRKALVSKSVDGMLEEIYTAMEFLATEENSSLSVAHFYEEKRGFGLAVTPYSVEKLPWDCLKFVALVMKHNNTVFTKHIHRFHVRDKDMRVTGCECDSMVT